MSVGRNHRTLPVRRGAWPSISTGSSSRSDQARTTAPSAGSWPVNPMFGSNVSWSMIVCRAYSRAVRPHPSGSGRRRTPGRRSCPTAAGPAGPAGARHRRWPSRRAPGRPAWRPCRRGRRPAPEQDLVRGVRDGALAAVRPRGAGPPATSGTSTAVSARTVRSEPNPTPRSRTCAGSPCSTSSVADVPSPPRKSPLIGDDRRAPPGTRSWYVAARRREDAEIDLRGTLGRAGRAADDGDLVDDDVAAAQQRAEAVRAGREHDDQRPASSPTPTRACRGAAGPGS